MPKVAGYTIEILTAIEAHRRGYLTRGEYMTHVRWVVQNFEERHMKLFVFIGGIYKGMSNAGEKLADIIDKFIK